MRGNEAHRGAGVPVATGALFMCEHDQCGGIHTHLNAMQHERDSGHHTLRLTDDETVAVRQMWRSQNRCWLCGGHGHEHNCDV